MQKILYLYREIMPYNIPVLRHLVEKNFKIKVIHGAHKKLTPYEPPKIENIEFISEKNFTSEDLKKYAKSFNPDLAFICDWSVRKYNLCGFYLNRYLKIPVVVGCDTQWNGGRQWLNVLSSRFRHKLYFTNILVAGIRQYEYAKKLGFKNNQILTHLYSADTNKFHSAEINKTKFQGIKNFLFVGRFARVKGLEFLIEAWNSISSKKGATLTLVGDGPLKDQLHFPEDVIVHDFLSQDDLLLLAQKATCFVLPSTFEPWALVIHEFAASGLPLIVTDNCGATPHFVINNYNGFIVESGSTSELQNAIKKIISASPQKLYEFAVNSKRLSKSITPELVASSLISVL